MSSEPPAPAIQSKLVYQDIPVYQIADPKYDTRVNIDPDLQGQLVESIRTRGILMPLRVRRQGDHFEVIAGHRRLLAAKTLELETVPCVIVDRDDSTALLESMAENAVRADNSPYEIMQGALVCVNRDSLGPSAIARTLGYSEPYIRDLLKLATLPPQVLECLHVGSLSVPAAKQLFRLETLEDVLRVGYDLARCHASGPAAGSLVNAYLVIKERQKDLPPEKIMEEAARDPKFECEWCKKLKSVRGSQGKVMCEDCYHRTVALWTEYRDKNAHKLVEKWQPSPPSYQATTYTPRTQEPPQ